MSLRITRRGLSLPIRTLLIALFILVGAISTSFAAPASFDLIGPGTADAPGPVVTDTSAVTVIQWERATDATLYTFALTYPDGTVLELENLTPGHNPDPLDCFTGNAICNLTVAGEQVLTQTGAYSWTVFAFDADGEQTEAANAPFYFRVGNLPGEFDLIGPGTAAQPGPEVTDPSAVTQIQWEESADADTYTFELTFPDNSVVELANLNDGEELNCDAGTCTLTVAGEQVLTQDGAYSWTVFAFNEVGSTEAGNAPFYFTVNAPDLPGAFDLIGPGTAAQPGPEVTDPSAVTQIQWEESAGADTYTFELTFPDNSVVELANLNDGEELNCDAGTCTLTVAGESVLTQDGAYSWTVFAFNANGSTEAGNAPFYFTVNAPDLPGAFDLIGPGSATQPGPEVTDPSAVTQIQWEESAGADTYTFELTFPDSSVVELANLNDGEELNCDAGTCTLTVAGESVLTQDGAYSWTVFAFNSNGSTEAGNAPYFFTVNTASAPESFGLVAPASGSSFNTSLPAQTPIQWGEAEGADSYRWILQKVSTNTRVDVGTVVDAANLNDGEELTCAEGVCTFIVDASGLDSGQYSWTVFATNADGTIEAQNGPFTFTIDLEGGLVDNNGFEIVGSNKIPEGWQVNQSGAKVKCNNGSKTVAYSGDCALNVKTNARLSQKLADGTLAQGDSLSLSAWVEGKNVTSGAVIRLVVKYNDGEKSKVKLDVPAGTYDYQPLTQNMDVMKPVANAKVIISSNANGRIRIDDLLLTKNASAAKLVPLPVN
jgi:hypothetical protein